RMASEHPLPVAPLVVERPQHRRRLPRRFVVKAERVGLVDAAIAQPRGNMKFIKRAGIDARYEPFPYARVSFMRQQRMRARIPAVELAYHADLRRVRRP